MALGRCSYSRQLTSVSFNHDQNLSTCLNGGLLVAVLQPHSQAGDDGPGKHQPHDSHMKTFLFFLFQIFIIDLIFQGTGRQTTRGELIMVVSLFTFHSAVVGSGLKCRFRVCGSRAGGIFPVNPGEMTSSSVIPGPAPASATGRVCLCVFTQNTQSIFFFPKPDRLCSG